MHPNYKKIYQDLLKEEKPEKLQDPKIKLLLNNLTTVEDILKLNSLIFDSSTENVNDSQRLRTYDKKTILKLLQYQDKHHFSTSYMSRKYKISRTTLAKWRKTFGDEVD